MHPFRFSRIVIETDRQTCHIFAMLQLFIPEAPKISTLIYNRQLDEVKNINLGGNQPENQLTLDKVYLSFSTRLSRQTKIIWPVHVIAYFISTNFSNIH